MSEPSDQEKLEEIYRVLSDLRYLMHQESNDLQDFQRIARDYYGQIATAADYVRAMLPSDAVAKHDDP